MQGLDEAGEEALRDLIEEGEAIRAKIGELMGQSFLLAGVKLTISLLDEDLRDLFWNMEQTVKKLNLPKPVYHLYTRYARWNRACLELMRKYGWMEDERVREFGRLRREFGGEVARKSRYLLLEGLVSEQVSLLRSMRDNPPGRRRPQIKAAPLGGGTGGWSTRRILLTSIYTVFCFLIDTLLFPFAGFAIFGLVGAEVAIILGLPRLIEWLQTEEKEQEKRTPAATVATASPVAAAGTKGLLDLEIPSLTHAVEGGQTIFRLVMVIHNRADHDTTVTKVELDVQHNKGWITLEASPRYVEWDIGAHRSRTISKPLFFLLNGRVVGKKVKCRVRCSHTGGTIRVPMESQKVPAHPDQTWKFF